MTLWRDHFGAAHFVVALFGVAHFGVVLFGMNVTKIIFLLLFVSIF